MKIFYTSVYYTHILILTHEQQQQTKYTHIKKKQQYQHINIYTRQCHFDKWKAIELPIFIYWLDHMLLQWNIITIIIWIDYRKNGPLIVDTLYITTWANGCNRKREWEIFRGKKFKHTHTDTGFRWFFSLFSCFFFLSFFFCFTSSSVSCERGRVKERTIGQRLSLADARNQNAMPLSLSRKKSVMCVCVWRSRSGIF